MKFTVFAAFLFSIGWMSVALAGEGRPVACCLTVSETRIPAVNIVKYDIQNKTLCPVKAVRFHTKKNKVICSDPDSDWAKKTMDKVDGRLTTKPSPKPTTCYTRTTNVIPTTATTNKTPGTETETSTSTTVPPAVTAIKTSETETSTSTIVPTTVTTIETSTPETEISKTTILPTSVSTDNTESTAITCGTGETTAPPTITTTTTGVTNTTKKKKRSKMIIRKSGKSKKGLRRVQMSLNSTRWTSE